MLRGWFLVNIVCGKAQNCIIILYDTSCQFQLKLFLQISVSVGDDNTCEMKLSTTQATIVEDENLIIVSTTEAHS